MGIILIKNDSKLLAGSHGLSLQEALRRSSWLTKQSENGFEDYFAPSGTRVDILKGGLTRVNYRLIFAIMKFINNVLLISSTAFLK